MDKGDTSARNAQIQEKPRERERGVLKGPLGCPVNCMQKPERFDYGDGKDEKTRHVTLRSAKSRPNGLYVSGFIGQSKLNWLVDTKAVRNILF